MSFAAMAAWPSERPPSLAVIARLDSTRKLLFLKSLIRRLVRYQLQNTPPLSATVSGLLARLAASARAFPQASQEVCAKVTATKSPGNGAERGCDVDKRLIGKCLRKSG
jgi:hypothetical protein